MFLDDFILRLREYGVPVSLTDAIDFYKGMERGLAPDLDSLFLFARLAFVRRVEHMDAYERAFAFHFYGLDLPRVAEGDPELFNTPQFREWLKAAVRKGELPPHAMWTFPPDELMKRFWETMRQQTEAHQGGSRWIGTGGNSPFGHSGSASGGVRVFGKGGKGSALKVIGERRYIDYSDDKSLSHANLSQALASMKSLKPSGPRDELDLDATIYESARNGGEIDLVFRRALLDRIEVILLIDNGGSSMIPHVALTRLLFAKVRDRFKRRDTYFFHNTIYGTVYKDAQRRLPLPVEKLLQRSPETRLLILGDASMAPEELLYPGGAITWGTSDAEPSLRWLERLRDRFRHSVWLNPIPKENWPEAYGRTTLKRIGEVFRMEDLTLGGIKRAVEWLNRK
ncbi:MAG: uncharacterized protein QOF89_1283 [Acidobacteriota bacterium]|jgi:uncharacterized protein with von Willebrand factor type A (vWA) domain|nr:uncharacterized protein [Acidobacteriota bacterium]